MRKRGVVNVTWPADDQDAERAVWSALANYVVTVRLLVHDDDAHPLGPAQTVQLVGVEVDEDGFLIVLSHLFDESSGVLGADLVSFRSADVWELTVH